MKKALGLIALGGALALAGCATSKERVTLLSPVQEGKPVGGVVVEYEDGEAYLSAANQQAKLRGTKVPRLRQLDEVDPVLDDLMNGLPTLAAREFFYFATGKGTLSTKELDKLQNWLNQNIGDRPGLHIEIAAHTDATGSEQVNDRLSKERANAVLGQVLERVQAGQIEVSQEDIDVVASSWHWARSGLAANEAGRPNPAYRVVVVTVR